ncbi:MAG: hypothetical protein AMXMBFR7_18980 [Planctomycetota bacterium]
MTWVHPALLWALPVALLPIAIYYLMRFRSLSVRWGAHYVLARALARYKKNLYWEQIVLLGLRALACAALVLAFARPTSSAPAETLSGTGVTRIVVLDASYSMLAGPEGSSRWSRTLDALRELAGQWGRGEEWSLYRMGETPRWLVERARVSDPLRTAEAFEGLEPDEASANLAQALGEIAARFPNEKVELYVCADDQASTWEGMDAWIWPTEPRPDVFWINPPLEDRGNLAVTGVRLAGARVLRKHPVQAVVSVKNFGAAAVQDAEVELLLDGTHLSRESISLLPGQQGELTIPVLLDESGSHALSARVSGDALAFDNRFSAGLEVSERITVQVPRDADKRGKFDSCWAFLELAQQIQQRTTEDGAAIFHAAPLVFASPDGEPELSGPGAPEVVILDGGFALNDARTEALRGFVARGGALVLAADDRVDAAAWNTQLGAAGLLPAALGEMRTEPLAGERFERIAKARLERGGFSAFASAEDGDVEEARFFAWYETAPPTQEAQVLAWYAGGTPYALLRRGPGGSGSILLLTAGLNGRDNNLAVREFFLPFLYRLFMAGVSEAGLARTVERGAPIRIPTRTGEAQAATWTLGTQPPRPLQRQAGTAGEVWTLPEGSDRTGLGSVLLVNGSANQRIWLGVQGPRMDSDLRALEPASKAAFLERTGALECPDARTLLDHLRARQSGDEWHHWAMWGVLAFLLGELWFQRRMG